jgi:hypothetical protein
MENNYTLWQRLVANTPVFFKKVQVIGLAVAGLGTSLSQVQGMSSKLTTILISAGSAMAIIAQFAVKQYEPSNTQNNATK